MSGFLIDFISALNDDFDEYCSHHLGDCEITPGQIAFLVYIGEHPDCSPTELARAVRADSGHTTRSVKKLVSCGMAIRRKHSTDGRAFVLSLTDDGMKVFKRIKTIYASWESDATLSLEPAERAQLLVLLAKMRGMYRSNT